MRPCLPKTKHKRTPPARYVKSNGQLVCTLLLLGGATQLCSMGIARFEAKPPLKPKLKKRAAVLIVGETRSLFYPRVYELCRRHLLGGLASDGDAVDVFLRLDRSIKKSEGSESQRQTYGARGVPEITSHLPDAVLAPMLRALRPVQVSWFVSGLDEGDSHRDAGLDTNGTLLPWRSLSIEERSLALMRAFDRPLWSQWWNRYQAYMGALRYAEQHGFVYDVFCVARSDSAWLRPVPPLQALATNKVTVPDVWMLSANDHFMAAPKGELAERLLDMASTGRGWCFGNPYGLSPFHGRSRRPEAPCDYAAIRSVVVSKLAARVEDADLIARDIVGEYCCSGERGKRFKTPGGHTEHLLARKVCGREGQDCGDHERGFVDLAQTRFAQTIVRSHVGADCGRLTAYQGNPNVRRFRPSIGSYNLCVLLFHDCRFRDRRRPSLGPFGGGPLSVLDQRDPSIAGQAQRCGWPSWFREGNPPEPSQLRSPDGRCVTVVDSHLTLAACIDVSEPSALVDKSGHRVRHHPMAKPVRHHPSQLFALLKNTDAGVEILNLDTRLPERFQCLRPGGASGLTVGACDALYGTGAARETAFVLDGGTLLHSSGACVVGETELGLGGCASPSMLAVEVFVVEP